MATPIRIPLENEFFVVEEAMDIYGPYKYSIHRAIRNKLIIGTSPYDLYSLTIHFLTAYLEQQAHVVILSSRSRYQPFCSREGGRLIEDDSTHPTGFNPFLTRYKTKDGYGILSGLYELLCAIWKRSPQELFKENAIALGLSLSSYYTYLEAGDSIHPSLNTYYYFLQVHFPDTLKSKGLSPDLFVSNGFLDALEPFSSGGPYEYLLNAPTIEDLFEEKLVVFNLANLPVDPLLLHVTVLALLDEFNRKMAKLKAIRKVLVIEDPWLSMVQKYGASFLKVTYKNARNHFGEVWAVAYPDPITYAYPYLGELLVDYTYTRFIQARSRVVELVQTGVANSPLYATTDDPGHVDYVKNMSSILELTDQEREAYDQLEGSSAFMVSVPSGVTSHRLPFSLQTGVYTLGAAGQGRHLILDPRTMGTTWVERSKLLAYFASELKNGRPVYYYPDYTPLPSGYRVRFNPDGSEDVVYQENDVDYLIQSITPPGKGEFVYLSNHAELILIIFRLASSEKSSLYSCPKLRIMTKIAFFKHAHDL